MPTTRERVCPACQRTLDDTEQLKEITGIKRTPKPTANPPKFRVFICERCDTTFKNVLLLLGPHMPQAVNWPEEDTRRPERR